MTNTPAYFHQAFFAVGQKINYSGFAGVVVRHYCEGMWEIRLSNGLACVSGAHIQVR
jgi:hypothetical protein